MTVSSPTRSHVEAAYDPETVMLKVQEMYSQLPAGWSKNKNTGNGSAPFVHEDGRTSWKHPSRDQIDTMLKDMGAGSPPPNAPLFRSLNRYVRMLKSGIPRAAVEQRARVEGDDPAKVMAALDAYENGDANDENVNDENVITRKPVVVVYNSNYRRIAIRKYPRMVAQGMPVAKVQDKAFKKYSAMIKAGIPMQAVEQSANVEGVTINRVALGEGNNFEVTIQEATDSSNSAAGTFGKPSLKKYKMMLKAGLSVESVLQSAKMDGVNIDNLIKTHLAEKEEAQPAFFTPTENGNEVSFQKATALNRLVSKLVQTVQKRATASTDLSVSGTVLYHALGSLRGVQHSRDVYNSTTKETCHTSRIMEVKAKRKPFLELASSIGIKVPSKFQEPMEIPGLDDLVAWIESVFAAEMQAIRSDHDMGIYDFDSLGELYRPGTRVVAKNAFAGGVGVMCEVAWNRFEQGRTLFGISKTFKVCFHFIVAVGDHFTIAEFQEIMENFDGKRPIQALSFVPKDCFNEEEMKVLLEHFAERGRLYNRIATKTSYMEYEKGSFYAKRTGGAIGKGSSAFHSSGRVMVDTKGSYEAGHSIGIGHEAMVMGIKYKYREYMLHMKAQKAKSDGKGGAADGGDLMVFDSVPEDYLTMTWPAVVGFSFHSKVWGDVLVDGLSDIQFQEDIFDKVVLPPSRKRMVKALVKHSSDSFNDVVRGKGEGSVFLLYGKPGTGKTLTAEAVCEMLHKPLYTVSLGQLGTSAAELETNLESILSLCSRWDALVLLDECDIFIEKRSSSGSLERNAMVSVMLRLVEYFKGVLFLTSNRVDSLDPAFKTRITLSLRYESLGEDARNKIWVNLLTASGLGTKVENGVIDTKALAVHELNGREIKNCIRLAMALAHEDGEELEQKFLIETIDILNEFNDQLAHTEAY